MDGYCPTCLIVCLSAKRTCWRCDGPLTPIPDLTENGDWTKEPFRRHTDEKVVGVIYLDQRILAKRVRYDDHLFRKLGGWGWDAIEFENKRGLFDLMVCVDDRGTEHWVALGTFVQMAKETNYAGHGRQLILAGRFWYSRTPAPAWA